MTATFTPARTLILALLLGLATLMSACAPLVVGGAAATTALVATDRRTAGEQVEDQAIEMKFSIEVGKAFDKQPNIRLTSVSYAGKVLIYGDVPNEADKERAQAIASGIENVKEVINRVRIGSVTPLSVRTNDTWITTKVKASLFEAKEVPAAAIVVTTERGVVYLMGKVTETEGRMAAKVAANVQGVKEVVKLFTIVSRESLVQQQQDNPPAESTAPAQPAASSPSSNPDVQTMPVQ
ncbi:MAG TPA: phospholipid-binding protein [Pusillimonas sp.]|jgi:osmotically-inducible protein OsmY|nr:phospholipid-binding protein [Pusillimonas sp.]|tara:strand:- start:27220 stop:27933 length:714 start_codon:yes stop_codon:yes gene_type:complete